MQNFDKILTIKPVRYAAAAHRTPYRAERRTACFAAKPENPVQLCNLCTSSFVFVAKDLCLCYTGTGTPTPVRRKLP